MLLRCGRIALDTLPEFRHFFDTVLWRNKWTPVMTRLRSVLDGGCLSLRCSGDSCAAMKAGAGSMLDGKLEAVLVPRMWEA